MALRYWHDFFGSPNWESEAKTTRCYFYRSDVSRCERFKLSLLNEEVRHKSRRAHSGTSDRLRSKRHLVRAGSGKRKKQSFSELLYGSPNWESEAKTTKCCFYRSDVSRCEQFELSLLNDEVRHKSRRAHSRTSDRLRSKHHMVRASSGKRKKQSILELLYELSQQF